MNILKNIRGRVTLWFLLIVVILIAFFGITSYVLLSNGLSQNTVYPWDMRTGKVNMLPDGSGRITYLRDITNQIGMEKGNDIILIQQFSRDELISSDSEDNTIMVSLPGDIQVHIEKALLVNSGMSGDANIWVYFLQSQSTPDDLRIMVVNQSTGSISNTLYVFRRMIIITSLITLVLAGLLSFLLVNKIIRPIKDITRTAKEIEENNLDSRLDVPTDDELGQLAETLNQMFERLEAAFVREREFTADVSHELRTPLAIAQGETTLALRQARSPEEYQKALTVVTRQISRISSIINRLLFLARSDDRLELVMSDVDVKSLLNEIISDAEVLCEQKGIRLRSNLADVSGEFQITGDAARLGELFLNLLDNAVRYTSKGGYISINLNRVQINEICVTVSDTGVGISEEQILNIFKRFHRGDISRSDTENGVGLGLAICQRIAEIHQGWIEVESKLGEGSTFTVHLPT